MSSYPKHNVAIILAFVVSLISGCNSEKPEAPETNNKPVNVKVQTVELQDIELVVTLPGRTNAYRKAEVRPQVGGIIESRLFEEGSDVQKGDALYQIASSRYEAAYAQAEANAVSLRLKEKRYKELAKIDAIGHQDYDDVKASLKQAEAALKLAKINLNYTHVYAPISGRIGKSNTTVGALVTADQSTAMATIQQLDPIYVDVVRSSKELLELQNQLASGQIKASDASEASVKLILSDGEEYPTLGTLKFSDATVNSSTGSITLRAVFPNPEHKILPGMFVQAKLVEGINQKTILVQQDYVSHNASGKAIVKIVNKSGVVEDREVNIGRSIGNQWIIKKGLSVGDQVITTGLQYVQVGSPVSIQ